MVLWKVIVIGSASIAAIFAVIYVIAMPRIIRRYNEMRLRMMPMERTRH